MADPMAVKLVITTGNAVLVETRGEGPHFPVYLCRRLELPQDAAKRVLKSEFGLEAERVVSLPIISRLPIEAFPEEERKNWPKGAKTIPCIAFSYPTEGKERVCPTFDWVYRKEALSLLEKADRDTFDSLN